MAAAEWRLGTGFPTSPATCELDPEGGQGLQREAGADCVDLEFATHAPAGPMKGTGSSREI